MFGWCATPAYYNVVSKTIDWAHNSGVSERVLHEWYLQQEIQRSLRLQLQSRAIRSLTYVDDSFGPCTLESAPQIISDMCVIIKKLLGRDSVNSKRQRDPRQVCS